VRRLRPTGRRLCNDAVILKRLFIAWNRQGFDPFVAPESDIALGSTAPMVCLVPPEVGRIRSMGILGSVRLIARSTGSESWTSTSRERGKPSNASLGGSWRSPSLHASPHWLSTGVSWLPHSLIGVKKAVEQPGRKFSGIYLKRWASLNPYESILSIHHEMIHLNPDKLAKTWRMGVFCPYKSYSLDIDKVLVVCAYLLQYHVN
jgi:hypothetical protein